MSWIIHPSEAIESRHAGGKARALARAMRAGLPVPDWFVLSPAAFEESLTADQRAAREDGGDRAPAVPGTIALAPGVAAALADALAALSPAGEPLAVRSSASEEDSAEHSFAGQFESFLNVPPAGVAEAVTAVWASGFTQRVLAYRAERGLPSLPHPPAVLIQRMVSPRAAGVAFGADPVSGRRTIALVCAVHGLGSAVVAGTADADTWRVDRAGTIVERRVAVKRCMHVADAAGTGVQSVEVPAATAERPALTDDEVRQVAALARAAGREFGRPQDIEWALADRLVLLQSRPITSIRDTVDPDAPIVIWDNSNIVESYSGVTTPMTFSFVREIYEHVYRQFCRMMGVPERAIAAADDTFRNMLGLVRGRLFYNLLSWYRVLAMLPGYRINRRFMELMMGVKEALPDALSGAIAESAGGRGRALDAAYAARTVCTLAVNHVTIDRRVAAFFRRLDRALAPPNPPLEQRRIDELAAHYRDLRGRLLLRWDAPLVNDFFAMIFYGVLRNLVTRWCGDPAGTLQNDLIGGSGGLVSAEPAVRMQRLARLAAGDADLVERLASGTLDAIHTGLARHPEMLAQYQEYLARFGDRTVNELKLESATLHDDPLPLLRAVGVLARRDGARGASEEGRAERQRIDARRRADAALARHPLRRVVFAWVLRHAQRRVRDRENLRLERTRLFGRVRRIVLEMGRRLEEIGRLDAARDVFYLQVDELIAFVEGRAVTTDLRALAALRRQEFEEYERSAPPDDRFETRGPVYHGHAFRNARQPDREETGESRQGVGCSPGIVRGPVCIVRDPLTATVDGRAILVAEHTDPGWIVVFPFAQGVLVERGSLLSHAAIVARELGIPAVVAIPGVTAWLRDGDWVEMDGGTGLVRRLSPPPDDA